MKIPLYSSNYTDVVNAPYSEGFNGNSVDLKSLIKFMSNEFIQKYKTLDVRKINEYISSSKSSDSFLSSTFDIDGKSLTGSQLLSSIKLLLPTLWNCNYFVWDIGAGTHHGIDIILPKGTPLPAFVSGKIVKVKQWDGVKKDDGNCVVLQSNDNQFICYEHLDSINVISGQQVNQGDILGTCGKTGNATQYHLHLQIDTAKAAFHPFWSSKIEDIQQYTIDPVSFLKKIYGVENAVTSAVVDNVTKPVEKPTITVPTVNNPVESSPKPDVSKPAAVKTDDGDDMINNIVGMLNEAYKK